MINADNEFKLSVLLVTYNHESHIVRALESLLKQDYPGSIQLVIANDGSTDNTLHLIRNYEGSDPRFSFTYLAADTNVGITRNYQRGFAACNGEYVAVLEGDDYWVSPKKLSRQLAFLSDHWECDLCSVNYFVLNEVTTTFSTRVPVGTGHLFLHARDLIADNLIGNFSTCMYRKSALDELPAELFDVCSYDWIVNICVASTSLVGFLQEPMSVYRVHSSGAWSNYQPGDKLRLQLNLIPTYDRLTQKRFHTDFNRLKQRLRLAVNLKQVDFLFGCMSRPMSIGLSLMHDFMPPIAITIIRALTPPLLAKFVLKIANRRRTL